MNINKTRPRKHTAIPHMILSVRIHGCSDYLAQVSWITASLRESKVLAVEKEKTA
jgi:hypothetical protein